MLLRAAQGGEVRNGTFGHPAALNEMVRFRVLGFRLWVMIGGH